MGGPTGAQDDGGAALHRGSLLAHGRPVLADVCVVPPHPTVLPPSSLSSLNPPAEYEARYYEQAAVA